MMLLTEMIKAKYHANLVPVKKQIIRNDHPATITYWVKPEEAAAVRTKAAPIMSAEDKNPPERLKQPVKNMQKLYELVEEARPMFEDAVKELQKRHGGDIKSRDSLKSQKRVREKIKEDRASGGIGIGPHSILDIDGKTLVHTTLSDISKVYETLIKSPLVVRAKNRFRSPLKTGYRDILCNVKLKNGAIVELQLQAKQMLAVKEAVGHTLYEVERELDPIIGGGNEKARAVQMKVIQLERQVYGTAWKAVQEGDANFKAEDLVIGSALSRISAMLKSSVGFKALSDKTRKHFLDLAEQHTGRVSKSKKIRFGSLKSGIASFNFLAMFKSPYLNTTSKRLICKGR